MFEAVLGPESSGTWLVGLVVGAVLGVGSSWTWLVGLVLGAVLGADWPVVGR